VIVIVIGFSLVPFPLTPPLSHKGRGRCLWLGPGWLHIPKLCAFRRPYESPRASLRGASPTLRRGKCHLGSSRSNCVLRGLPSSYLNPKSKIPSRFQPLRIVVRPHVGHRGPGRVGASGGSLEQVQPR